MDLNIYIFWFKDNIIPAYRPGLKAGMDLRGLVQKGVWKNTFFGLK